jgi:hypothetical protein
MKEMLSNFWAQFGTITASGAVLTVMIVLAIARFAPRHAAL